MWNQGDALGTDGGLIIICASGHTQGGWERKVKAACWTEKGGHEIN